MVYGLQHTPNLPKNKSKRVSKSKGKPLRGKSNKPDAKGEKNKTRDAKSTGSNKKLCILITTATSHHPRTVASLGQKTEPKTAEMPRKRRA